MSRSNVDAGATVTEYCFWNERDSESVTCAVKDEFPIAVGMPDIKPVNRSSPNPEGSEPFAIVQTKGGVPPPTVS